MIDIAEVSKIYNKGKSNAFQALKKVSIKIDDGEYVAIIGKSGAGKSTLLHILSGVDTFEEGNYRINDDEIGKMSDKQMAKFRNQRVGMVMQDFALIEGYTVEENVMIPLIFGKQVEKKKRKQRVKEVVEELGIGDLLYKQVNKLSGGQKQRVAIARAIVTNPDFILADEPTGALDSHTSDDIMKVFTKLNKEGHTVVIVTHDLEVANQCGRIIEISDGKIVS